ncbi:MAG TPA: polysaccharide biosynthesis protein [Bacteroidia bacterium]|nr:polysaccharide biosynthesis protein [Bacteroidia bacterium]
MKKILITGGTGFLGKELGRQLKKDYTVYLSGRNNTQNMWAQRYTGCEVLPMDVSSIESVRDGFNSIKPDIIIHAAATKFVDISEKQPFEAVDVNVLGSQNVARVALDKNIETVIGISTDKAVPPVRNTYALTKALMERMYCSLSAKSSTRFACVRFGNIAWSSGSVLPIWKKMFDETGVISTTGPEMRRYFIMVAEASEIVITCLNNIAVLNGNVLTKDMKCAQIEDLLKTWIKHKGGKWEKVAGRPGDRIDEHLVGESEKEYTTEAVLNNELYYITSMNTKSEKPVKNSLSTETAKRFSEDEMLAIINGVPAN